MRRKYEGFVFVALMIALSMVTCAYLSFKDESTFTYQQRIAPTIAEDATAPALYHYEATKETTIDDEGDYLYVRDNALVREDGDKRYLVALDGGNVLSQPVNRIDFVREDYAVIETESRAPHNKGIVSLSKGVLVKPEAALIEPVTCADGEPRFVLVAYATNEMKGEDTGFLSVSKNGLVSFYSEYSTNDDDAVFDGYALVYDLEVGALVDGIRIEQPGTDIYDFGVSLLVANIEEQRDTPVVGITHEFHSVLYEPSGKELWSGDSRVYAGAHSFCCSGEGHIGIIYSIIDATGTTRYTTGGSLTPISGLSDLYHLYLSTSDDQYVNMDGAVAFESTGSTLVAEADGLYEIQGEDYIDSHDVLNKAGEPICEGSSLSCVLPGYAIIETGKQEYDYLYSLYSKGELLASDLYWTDTQLLVFNDGNPDDNTYWSPRNYYVFANHTCSLELTACDKLDIGLVSGAAEEYSPRGVYDLFTGEMVIPERYDIITKAGDYVFAHADDAWDVYHVQRLGPTEIAHSE